MAEESLNYVVNNPSHVLFLHPSNTSNNIVVSELMNGDNYDQWKKAMKVALIAKNKLGFVLGDWSKPSTTSPLTAQRDRCDKMVTSWLINAIIKDIRQSTLFSSTDRDVWLQLERRFAEVDSTRLFIKEICLYFSKITSQLHITLIKSRNYGWLQWYGYNSTLQLWTRRYKSYCSAPTDQGSTINLVFGRNE